MNPFNPFNPYMNRTQLETSVQYWIIFGSTVFIEFHFGIHFLGHFIFDIEGIELRYTMLQRFEHSPEPMLRT